MTTIATRPSARGETPTRAVEIVWETGLFSHPAQMAVSNASVPSGTTVDTPVEEARASYVRVSARAAYQWALYGRAVIVDIRPVAQRLAEGEVHPDLRPVVIERNVLEARLDPRSDAHVDWVSADTRVVVLCQEGHASSLAAASLARLGLCRATDVVGGLRAWREAGLPLADGAPERGDDSRLRSRAVTCPG
ncbi:MAG: rhodanese-like domain-containing protein [Lapillicoccus sp.]